MDKSHVVALRRAVEMAGSQAAFAEGIAKFLDRPTFSQQTVSYWLKKAVLLEAEYWPAVEHVSKGTVTREQLRPDVFRRSRRPRAELRSIGHG